MNPMTALLPRWLNRQAIPLRGAVPSSLMSRIEVCPPELFPSSITLAGRLRRWWRGTQRPVNRLNLVKNEFRCCLDDLTGHEAAALGDRIEQARSLREFWHLRSTLFNLLALEFNQGEAERRLGRLNRHFPTRAPRSSASLAQA